ncbi:MAG: hypothetical protein MI755_01315 [Sphingomonadales bacterium]|nr:hypothetical protein [Sphingomonadales bacterium]
MRPQALAIFLGSLLVVPAGAAHEDFAPVASDSDWRHEFPVPAFRYSPGCDVLFAGDRRLAYHGQEVSPPVTELVPQQFGPDTSGYSWNAVYRHMDQPCQGILEVSPEPHR